MKGLWYGQKICLNVRSEHLIALSSCCLLKESFTFHFHALEKEMATHSSVLVWRIPGTGEPGGLPSVGSHRLDTTEAAAAARSLILCFHLFLPVSFIISAL